MPAATVSHNDEGEPAEGRTMNDEIAALVAAAARLPAAERHELIEAIADTLADEACEPLSSEWKAELERRVAESDAGIGETVPWERRSPEPTSEELVHLRAIRESIAEELLDLVARDQRPFDGYDQFRGVQEQLRSITMIQERDEVVLTCDLPEQKLAAGDTKLSS